MNTAAADAAPAGTRPERRPAAMPAIIAIVLIAILALMVLGFAVHLLFSPWLLLVAVAVVAWIKFRPRRTRP
jgi:hypothetical protein